MAEMWGSSHCQWWYAGHYYAVILPSKAESQACGIVCNITNLSDDWLYVTNEDTQSIRKCNASWDLSHLLKNWVSIFLTKITIFLYVKKECLKNKSLFQDAWKCFKTVFYFWVTRNLETPPKSNAYIHQHCGSAISTGGMLMCQGCLSQGLCTQRLLPFATFLAATKMQNSILRH